MDALDPYDVHRDPGSGVPIVSCDCGDCELRHVDCCNDARPTCETVEIRDSAGVTDVIVCRQGFGCDDRPPGCPWTCPDSRTCPCAAVTA